MPEAWTLSWHGQCVMGLGYTGGLLSWQAQPNPAGDHALQAAADLLRARPGCHSAIDLQWGPTGGLCALYDQHLVFQLPGAECKTVALEGNAWQEARWSPTGSHILCLTKSGFSLVDVATAALVRRHWSFFSQSHQRELQPCFSPCGLHLAWLVQAGDSVELKLATLQLKPLISCAVGDWRSTVDMVSCSFSTWGDQVHVKVQSHGVAYLTVVSFSQDGQASTLISALKVLLG